MTSKRPGWSADRQKLSPRPINHGDECGATKADLDTADAGLRDELYRALWMQGAVVAAKLL